MSDPMDTIRDIVYPGRRAPVTPIVPEFSGSFTEPYTDDDIQAAGDNLRDLIESSLIVSDPPAPGWTPNPEDLA